MAQYTLDGKEKKIGVLGIYASIKNNSDAVMYGSAMSGIDPAGENVTPIQPGESVVIPSNNDRAVFLLGTGDAAVLSGNKEFNFFKPAPKGGGGSGDGITQQQLNDTLKTYATNTSVDTKLEEYASKDEIPTSLPADGGNADTVGGKSAEELIQSNPNLLLNPDFKVNQRGKSKYGYDGSDRYTVDRWKLQANLTLTVHSDYVTVSRHDPTSNSHTGFRQKLNIPDDTSVTLQACVKGNGSFTLFHNGFSGTAEIQVQDTDGWVVVKCTGYGASEAGVLLRGTATSLDIKWIKLELGAVSTPFVPPNQATELVKCQRYFFRKAVSIPFKYGDFAADNSNGKYVAFVESFPVAMRTTPTVTVQAVKLNDTTGQMSKWIDGSTIVGSEVRVNGTTSQGFSSILISKPGTATEGMTCSIKYEASADL